LSLALLCLHFKNIFTAWSFGYFRTSLHSTLVCFIPIISLPHTLPSYLKWFLQVSLFYLHVYIKYIGCIHHALSSVFTFLLTSTTALTGSVLHSCPSLLKYMFIVQRGFAMVFHLWICCTLVNLMFSVTLPYPFPQSILFNTFQCIWMWLLHKQSWCISLLFTLPLPPPPNLLIQSHYWKHVLYIYIYIWYLFLCICLTFGSFFHKWKKWPWSFWSCLTSLNMMIFSSTDLPTNDNIWLFFMAK
jgi:hypothetical protein